MKHQFMEYVSNLQRQKEQPVLVPVLVPVPDGRQCLLNKDRFPILPNLPFDEMKKIELKDLLQNYLTHHYHMSHPSLLFHCLTGMTCTDLVSGNTTHHIPLASLEKATSKFVSTQYLPTSFIIQDPCNLKKQEIQSFLLHIKQWQEQHNPEELFRFQGYEW